MRAATRPTLLGLAGLSLAACGGGGAGGKSGSAPGTDRVATFIAVVESANCELPHTDNERLLRPAGFSDAEAGAISRQLLADGRATIARDGDLVLHTENCI